MKLVVFAHTPPPLHGQSAMVATLVDGLSDDPDIEILHINVRLSRTPGDIGRAHAGKLWQLLAACGRAWRLRARHGRCAFYYVPAPGRRVPLLRDLLVMSLCRPLFSPLILHWHAIGLGAWLGQCATPLERALARRLLGGAALSLALAPELAADAAALAPREVRIVPNSVPDPGEPAPRAVRSGGAPCHVLFLGQCSHSKGLFDTLEAVVQLESSAPARFRLTVAGSFASDDEAGAFFSRVASLRPGLVTHTGFADAARKQALFAAADVFCFPTSYPHEGQPLTLIEALAHDVPIVTTRWRAIPGMLPPDHVWFVEPGNPAGIAAALTAAAAGPRANGKLRAHYLARFTPQRHLATLRAALLSVRRSSPA